MSLLLDNPRFRTVVAAAFVLMFLFLVGARALLEGRGGHTLLWNGISICLTQASRSLVQEGTLSSPEYRTFYQELLEASRRQPAAVIWQDCFSRGVDGRLYPKHSLLAVLTGAFFYWLFGEFGFWLATQIELFAACWAVFAIARERSGFWGAAFLMAMLPGVSTLLSYTYYFGFDLLGVALLFGGFAVAGRRPFLGGTLMGLSVWTRVSLLVLLPFLVFASLGGRREMAVRCAAGIVSVVLLLGVVNFAIWGSPLEGGYANLPHFRDGAVIEIDTLQEHTFSPSILAEHWRYRLFDPKEGVLPSAPVVIAGLLSLVFCWRSPHRRFWMSISFGALAYTLLMFSYSHWEGAGGNRYALPPVLLFSLPVAEACRVLMVKAGLCSTEPPPIPCD